MHERRQMGLAVALAALRSRFLAAVHELATV
jgi:hypothetical protein